MTICLLVASPAGAGAQGGQDVVHRVFLLGDTGSIEEPDHPVLSLLGRLAGDDPDATVIFLGDIVYGRGLLPVDHPDRPTSERRLASQLDAVRNFAGRVLFIPGNHDWDDSGPDGIEALARMEAFIEESLGKGNVFLPDDGLPGPAIVDLDPGPLLAIIDSEWYLRTLDKPYGETGRYDVKEDDDLLAALADVVRRADDRPLIIAAHHAVRSLGPHAGHFPLRAHLFPLTLKWEHAYLPLPVIGSLVPLGISWFGSPQDFSNVRYRAYRSAVEAMLRRREDLTIHAAGHEHALQVFSSGDVHFLVSGTASSPRHVAGGRGSAFTSSDPGLMEIAFAADGSARLRVWSAETPDVPAFESELAAAAPKPVPAALAEREEPPPPAEPYRTAAADPTVGAGSVRRFFLGSNNRAAWTRPVSVPTLDLARTRGDLRPVSRGGGAQTLSIRLEDARGRQFVLRSLTKDVSRTLPEMILGTVAEGIARDQMSVMHPYGALMVPPLAEAAGLFHTDPTVVFVPRDARFGPYEDDVADRIMLFEMRPDDDMTWAPGYEDTEEVVGSAKMYREITGDNDHRVDQAFFARARLLDMLISDWDRHRDQWRWAVIEPGDRQGKIYRPIGRDRDWAFNRMDGIVSILARVLMPKFQSFRPGFGSLRGLTQNGMLPDRRLTSGLTRADWEAEARAIVAAIDDSVVAAAVDRLPEVLRPEEGPGMARTLARRLERLPRIASDYYDLLSRQVDVVGSDKHEGFRVRQIDRDRVEVRVDRLTKEGEVRGPYYERVFSRGETREIRLYGLDGDDRFEVDGVPEGVSVYVIGGPGDDRYRDATAAGKGGQGRVRVHDLPDGMRFRGGPVSLDRRSEDPEQNRYRPSDFQVPSVKPLVSLGSNRDDGLFAGGGATWTHARFRKQPFGSRHTLVASVAARTGAFNVSYEAVVTGAVGGWNAAVRLEGRSRRNVRNWFGLGNETENTLGNATFYQARLSELTVSPALERSLADGSRLSVAPTLSRIDVRQDPDRFITQPQAGIDRESLNDHWNAGLDVSLVVDRRDSGFFPRYGFLWRSALGFRKGISSYSVSFGRATADLSIHHSPWFSGPLTLSARAGVEHNVGDFPFYSASTVGGRSNLRGWRGTRFAGRTAVFQNTEARLRLRRIRSLVANGELGILGFVDHGRVWTDGERSRRWHRGYGGGVWISIFDAILVSATVARSVEQTDFSLQTGFFF